MRQSFAKKWLPYTAPQQQTFTPQAQEKFQYVPLEPMLKSMLEVPQVFSLVFPTSATLTHSQPDPMLLKDFMDGSVYQEDLKAVLRSSDMLTVFLLLYADEVDICNPLGAKRGTHKLCLVYCSVLNIHPRYRSQLKSIYLLLIAKYKDICNG